MPHLKVGLVAGQGIDVFKSAPKMFNEQTILDIERVQIARHILNRRELTFKSFHTSIPTGLNFFQLSSIGLQTDVIDLIGFVFSYWNSRKRNYRGNSEVVSELGCKEMKVSKILVVNFETPRVTFTMQFYKGNVDVMSKRK